MTDPTDPEQLRPAEESFHCLVAGNRDGLRSGGCSFRGTWAEALAHAPVHPLPHPEDRTAWVPARRTFIGASEIGSIAGLTARYRTALDVWVDKVRAPVVDKPPNGRMRMGTLLEAALLQDYAERHQVTLTRPATRRHPSMPFIAATPDALVADGPAVRARYGVQVKVVGHRSAQYWDTGPPPSVVAQVQTEMACFDLEMVTVLAMIDSDEPREWEIERDQQVFDFLAELAEMFWRTAVVPRVLPIDFDESPSIEAVARAFPAALRPMAEGSGEELGLVVLYHRAKLEADDVEERVERLGAQLRAKIGDREGFTGRLGSTNVQATWKAPKGSPSWRPIAEDMIHLVRRLTTVLAHGNDLEKQWALDELRAADPDAIILRHTPEHGSRRLVVRVK